MANFIAGTTLIRTDRGTADNPNPIDPPAVILTVPAVYETAEELIAALPAAQQPAANRRGGYDVRHELRYYMRVQLRGVTLDHGRLLIDVEFWPTQAAYLAGDPPVLRNSFERQFNSTLGRNLGADMRQTIEEYLVRASFRNASGDERDPNRLATKNPDHPVDRLGLLRDGNVLLLDGAALER